MSLAGRWADLRVRLASAAAMLAIGAVELWLGGLWFQVFVAAIIAGMIWELLRMLTGQGGAVSLAIGGLAAVALLAVHRMPEHVAAVWIWPALAMALVAGAGLWPARRQALAWLLYAPLIVLAGHALIWMRDTQGVAMLLWVIVVVVVSDVCGYFAGRLLGGPKFWPRISPKKTWSGTLAGWIGALLVGWLFFDALSGLSKTGLSLGWVMAASVGLALAGQMGDIGESAIKRRMGVKDSSALIPGHGGLLDRFDALIAAAALAYLLGGIT